MLITFCVWISSGPSKFIILRPGRPTRVIDVRGQKKPAVSAKNSIEKIDTCLLGHVNATEQVSQMDVGDISGNHSAIENIARASPEEVDDLLDTDVQTRSACSSRSCSISSDQSLLLHNQLCSCGSESEAQDFDELFSGGNNPRCNTALLCVVHSQENNNHTQFSHNKPEFKNVPPEEHRNTTRATLCSRSNSVVSLSSVVSDIKPAFLTPSPSTASYPTSHSASLAMLNKSECTPSSAFYHKRHTLPGTFAEALTLLQFIPSNVSDDLMHVGSRSACAVNKSLDDS